MPAEFTRTTIIRRVRELSDVTSGRAVIGVKVQAELTVGHFETVPYNNSTLRSVYHIRQYDVERLKLASRPPVYSNCQSDGSCQRRRIRLSSRTTGPRQYRSTETLHPSFGGNRSSRKKSTRIPSARRRCSS